MSKIHELKILPEFFEAKLNGVKPFECRLDDRGFEIGDILRLREIHPIENSEPPMFDYTGREIISEVLYILRGFKGLQEGYVVMSERIDEIIEVVKEVSYERNFI